MPQKGHYIRQSGTRTTDIVFDKSIFLNVFNKDIRRVYIYKKAERLANALYLITPAFKDSVSLRSKIEAVALALTEAACESAARLHSALSRELLTLSSLLTMARSGGLLSPMNADLIIAEAQALLSEVTQYEEPQLAFSEPATLSTLARQASVSESTPRALPAGTPAEASVPAQLPKGHANDRQERIMSFIKEKGSVSIKDLAGVIRGVSEKTIQRELLGLVHGGYVAKHGERRWTTYTLPS